ncbi:MAG: leucine-rich repeat protein [Paludibacteraceae bacterium]|nr:leucine-rich repeat protein [Paludibacteraceae bacterium]
MRKRIFILLVTILAGLGNIRADEPDVKRSATDESGLFYVECDYYAATDQYVITLTGIAADAYQIWDDTEEKYVDNPQLADIVFPSKIHAKFTSYNKDFGGDDLEDDFEYELGSNFFGSQDYRIVETITFEEGVTAIPDYFYAMSEEEVMQDMWESYADNDASVLREISFPASLVSIGDYAFTGHLNLEKITFGPGLTSIGEKAFRAVHEYSSGGGGGMGPDPEEVSVWHSSITELELPESLERIGASAFQGLSQLKDLTLLEKITEIGAYAFDNTGIETLHLCLPLLTLSGTSPFASSPVKKLVILCTGSAESHAAIVPDHLMHGVTSQFDVTFVPMPGVGEKCEGYVFGESCFEGSGVKSVTLLKEVEESPMYPSVDFQKYSFRNTYWFKTLDLAPVVCHGNVMIEEGAFEYSGLETLTLNNRTCWINANAFESTRLKSVDIPQYINPLTGKAEPMLIDEAAFYNTQQLESVRILGSIRDASENNHLAKSVFERSGVKTVELPASIELVGARAFFDSGLTSFTGGTDLKAIEEEAFGDCKNLEKVDLSAANMKELGDNMFANLSRLAEFNFPAGLETIGGYAFQNTGFKSIDVPANIVKAFAFCDMDNLEKISFTGKDFDKAVTNLLSGCKNLKIIDFGNVKEFEENCINGCPAMESLVIPAKTEKMHMEAFTDIVGQIKTLTFNSNALKDMEDITSTPFRYMIAELYFGEGVKQVPAYAFSGMHITNSPELRADMEFNTSAFDGCTIDSLNWHYNDIETYPFKSATVIRLAFKDVKEIRKGLFSSSTIGNLYLQGVETVGESAFENAGIIGYYLNYTLTIPASVKEIKENAFRGVVCGNLVFEKGEGLTIGKDAFYMEKDAGAFETIRSYYDKDHIPAAEGGFNIADEVKTFYAGNCDDVSAYSSAPGWKDLNVKIWNGVSQYKYSFEIVGAKKERPIDYYGYSIYVNEKPLLAADPIDCSNKAVLKFDSPCSGDMKLAKWADGTTDPDKCEITLTSDTVIRIYVEEKENDLYIALKNPALGDAVRLYIQEEGGDWEEKTSGKTNSCSPATVKALLADNDHYTFNGWYNGPDDKAAQVWDSEEYTIYDGMTLYADVTVNKYNLTVEKDLMLCPDCDWQIDEMIVNEETSSYSIYQSVDYNAEVTVSVKGLEVYGERYILDYWADDAGNLVSRENPYVFNMPGYDVRLRPVMKSAGKYAVTVKSSDDALGTVTMTPETGAETESGSGLFWEGSKIELNATGKGMHFGFKKWNDGSEENPRTITVRNAFDYVAEFRKDSFDITVKVEGIDAALVEVKGEGRYGYDDEVKLSYTLNDDHYTFDRWLGDTYSEDAEYKFNAEKTIEVRIVFVPKVYNITLVASPAEGGTVTGDATAPYKANLILKAVANEGYVFDGWEDDKEAAAERTVEVLGDATYTALFVKETETGVEDMQADRVQTVKVLRDGMLYIIRGDKVYDALGTQVR